MAFALNHIFTNGTMHFKLLGIIICMGRFLYKVNLAFEIVCLY